jgi:Tat protein translocase TatC
VGLLGGQSVRRSADAQQTIQVHALKEEGAQHLHLASGGERWNILEEPNVSFISTQLTETLNTYITSILILSCVFSAPNIIYQLWCFLIPSCNSTQRMRLNQICVLSGLAFVCMLSVSFAYIMPNIWYFLLTCGQSSTNQFCIQLQPKIYDFIILTMRFLFCASICSQVPVILIILMEYNIISIQNCIKHRGIFFFCSLCIAAFITPPDLLCQLATSYGLYTCVELTLFYELVRLHYNDIFLALEQTPDINN